MGAGVAGDVWENHHPEVMKVRERERTQPGKGRLPRKEQRSHEL